MQCNLFVGVCILPIFAAGSQKMVAIAQLVRVSDCDSEGRGFEPHWLPQQAGCFSKNNLLFLCPFITSDYYSC